MRWRRLLSAIPVVAAFLLGSSTASAATGSNGPATQRAAAAQAVVAPGLAPLQSGSPLCLLTTPPAGLCARPAPSAGSSVPSQKPTTQAASNAWAIVDSPNLPGALRSNLAATSCPSAVDCWAVGEQISAADYSSPLAEHWDGTSWTITPSSAPAGALNTILYSLACPSASDCWAVGLYSTQGGNSAPVSEHWDGTSWTVATPPAPGGAMTGGLKAIACVSDSNCWAAGFWWGGGDFEPLVEQWNGASWTIVTSAPASTGTSVNLTGVGCSGSSDCWAVGSATPSAAPSQALIEHWDGSAWTASTAATPSAAGGAELLGVSCVSTALCWAVGDYSLGGAGTAQMLIEQWNGTSWALVTASDSSPVTAAALSSVTCASATDCLTAGYSTATGGGQVPLVEEWKGSSWASDGLANPSGAQSSTLSGIACSAGNCLSVGSESPSKGDQFALIEQLTAGTWQTATAPDPMGTQVNDLGAVTCVTASDCIAVGSHTSGASAGTLVVVWDGAAWSAVPSPSVGGGLNSFLNAVTCVSTSDCWAVGQSQPNNGSTASTLIESWDGSAWTIVTSPNPTDAPISALASVACASASDCWTVGLSYPVASNGVPTTGPVAVAQTLVERWNGQSWAIVSSPNTNPAQSNALTSVTCVSATDCWAVGVAAGTQTYQGLVEQWNGSAWQIVLSPQTAGTQSNGLFGVTCSAAASCWAVGYSYLGSGAGAHNFQTWTERWDGSAWSVVTSPDIGDDNVDALFAVTCAGAQDCWAVGTYGSGPTYQTLTMQWDGSAWAIAASPNPAGSKGTELFSVACSAGPICWSAGFYNDAADGSLQTLIEEYGGAPVQVPEAPWPLAFTVAAAVAVGLGRRRPRSLTISRSGSGRSSR